MTYQRRIDQALAIFSDQLRATNSSSITRNFVADLCLLKLLHTYQAGLPEIDSTRSQYKHTLLNHFKYPGATGDRALDSAIYCLLRRSSLFWQSVDLICAPGPALRNKSAFVCATSAYLH